MFAEESFAVRTAKLLHFAGKNFLSSWKPQIYEILRKVENFDFVNKDKDREIMRYSEMEVTQRIMAGILDWKDCPSQKVGIDRTDGQWIIINLIVIHLIHNLLGLTIIGNISDTKEYRYDF